MANEFDRFDTPANPFDAFDAATQEAPPVPKLARPTRTWGEAAADTGRGVMSGLAGIGKTAGDLYGLATGDMDNALSEAGRNAQEHWQAGQSDALKAKKADRSAAIDAADSLLGKAGTAIVETVTDPALLADTLAENAASFVPSAAAGRAGAAIVGGRELAKGAGKEAAAKAATRAGTAAAIGTGAVQQGGDVAGGSYETAMAQTDAQWAENPTYAARVAAGEDAATVKHELALAGARLALPGAAAVSVASQAIPGGATLEKAVAGAAAKAAGKSNLGSRAINAATGAAGEGMQEAIEEGGGQFVANLAQQQYANPDGSLSEGVGEAAGMGFVGGAGMGGVVGGLQRPTLEQPATPTQAAPPIPALPAPGAVTVDPQGNATTPQQAYDAARADAAFAAGRADAGLTPDVNAARAGHPAAASNIEAPLPMPGSRALPAPDPTLLGRPDGTLATASQLAQQGLAAEQNDVRLAQWREGMGLTPDVNAARAGHPGAAPNMAPARLPFPNAAPGSLAGAANTLAANGAAARPVIEGTATRVEATTAPAAPQSDDTSIVNYLVQQARTSGRTPGVSDIVKAYGLEPDHARALRKQAVATFTAQSLPPKAEPQTSGELFGETDDLRNSSNPADAIAQDSADLDAVANGSQAAGSDIDVEETRRGLEVDRADRDALREALAKGVSPVDGKPIPSEGFRRQYETELANLDVAVEEAERFLAEREGASKVTAAATEAATSPANDRPEPTDAQKDAGNYKKGHVRVNGHAIAIENPAGTSRRPEWPPLANHYGYIKGTVGKDKDHVDVFMTERAEDAALPVFVVDQIDPKTGRFDEHKVIMGAATEQEARATYKANYAPGWKGLGGVTQMTQEQFKAWVKDPAQTKRRASHAPVVAEEVSPAEEAALRDRNRTPPAVPGDTWDTAKVLRDKPVGEVAIIEGEPTEQRPDGGVRWTKVAADRWTDGDRTLNTNDFARLFDRQDDVLEGEAPRTDGQKALSAPLDTATAKAAALDFLRWQGRKATDRVEAVQPGIHAGRTFQTNVGGATPGIKKGHLQVAGGPTFAIKDLLAELGVKPDEQVSEAREQAIRSVIDHYTVIDGTTKPFSLNNGGKRFKLNSEAEWAIAKDEIRKQELARIDEGEKSRGAARGQPFERYAPKAGDKGKRAAFAREFIVPKGWEGAAIWKQTARTSAYDIQNKRDNDGNPVLSAHLNYYQDKSDGNEFSASPMVRVRKDGGGYRLEAAGYASFWDGKERMPGYTGYGSEAEAVAAAEAAIRGSALLNKFPSGTEFVFPVVPERAASKKAPKVHEKATAPEHLDTTDVGMTVDELRETAKLWREHIDGGGDAEVTHIFDAPAKGEVVRLADKVKVYHKDHGWMTPAEAKAKIDEWEANALKQGRDEAQRSANAGKVVLSLFDLSGQWSQPWEQAGYEVWRFDIQDESTYEDNEGVERKIGDVNNMSAEFFMDLFGAFEDKEVYAVLAACPCTDFAVSGARHFAAKDADGRTVSSVKLVEQTLAVIEFFKPPVWALENPVGRIEGLTGLPPWRLAFDPNHVGEDYTKKTLIWGRFNADLPIAPTEPTAGSKMHKLYGGKSMKTKNARSETPEGFAYAFFHANNAIDNPMIAVAGKYDRLDRDLIAAALDKGVTPQQIDNAVENFYYQELDDAAANRALAYLGEHGYPTPETHPDDIDAYGTIGHRFWDQFADGAPPAPTPPAKPTAGEKVAATAGNDQPTKKAAPEGRGANKRHAVDVAGVLTPGGALKADAYNSRADSSVWWHQGDVNMVQFNAKITMEGATPEQQAKQQRAGEEWGRISAARKAGWSLRSYRAGSYGTVWTFEKDGKLLTRAGFEHIANAAFAPPTMPVDEPGFESLARQQIAVAEAFVRWLDTLPEEQQNNLSVVSRKIGETPIHVWARIEDSGYGNGKALRYFDPAGKGAGSHGAWRIQIPLGLDAEWPQSVGYLRALAAKAGDVGTREGYRLLAEAKREAGMVFDVTERDRLQRESRPASDEPAPAEAPRAPAREVVAVYQTGSGKEAMRITRETRRDGAVTYSYTGSVGAGSGHSEADMRAEVSRMLAAKKGVKLASGVSMAKQVEANDPNGQRWQAMTAEQRVAVLRQPGGWSTTRGDALNPTGKKIAARDWSEHPENTRATLSTLMAKATTTAEAAPVAAGADTLDGQLELFKRLADGAATLAEYRAGFEALRTGRERIIADLGKLSKTQLLPLAGTHARLSEPKERLVRAAYDDLVTDYNLAGTLSWTMGERIEDVIAAKVAAATEQSLQEYAERVGARRAERKARIEAVEAGMENPQTIEDFTRIARSQGGEASLSPEQRETFDRLRTEARREQREAEAKRNAEIRQVDTGTTGMTLVETKHTQKGHDLFVVRMDERVERDVYDRLNTAAKRLGGHYSSYRGNGAVPGFTFTTRTAAEQFMAVREGNVDASTQQAARAEAKADARAETLAEKAASLRAKAEASLNRDRKDNTARRARMAASAEADARRELATADTMDRIAKAIEAGDAGLLAFVRHRTQVELLDTLLRNAHWDHQRALGVDWEKAKDAPITKEALAGVTLPGFHLSRGEAIRVARRLVQARGGKQIGQELAKQVDYGDEYGAAVQANPYKFAVAKSTADGGERSFAFFAKKRDAEAALARSPNRAQFMVVKMPGAGKTSRAGQDWVVALAPDLAIERGLWAPDFDKKINVPPSMAEKFIEVLGVTERGDQHIPYWWVSNRQRRQQLAKLGIETSYELREALRQYLGMRETPTGEDRVRKLERALAGNKSVGVDFFPTPPAVVQRLIEQADIEPGMRVLEPSAGKGDIAEAMRDAAEGVTVDTVEMSHTLREILEAKGFEASSGDFLEFQPDAGYDRIVMNPPFGNDSGASHVRHAYGLLKPGGRLVAVMGTGQRGKAEFEAWLEDVGGIAEPLPEGSFKSSFRPTGVATQVVVIDKRGDGALASTEELDFDDLPPELQASFRRQSDKMAEDAAERELAAQMSREDGEADADRYGLRAAVNRLLGPSGLRVQYLRGYEGLPDGIGEGADSRFEGRDLKTAALYDPASQTVYLFTHVVRDPNRAAWHAAHEIAGHDGLRKLLGAKLDAALRLAGENPTVAKLADAIAKDRGLSPRDRLLAIEEALAELAAAVRTENFNHIQERYGVAVPQGIRAKVAATIQEFLRRLKNLLSNHLDAKFSDRDVRELLEAAWKAAQGESTAEDSQAAAVASQANDGPFYSALHRSVIEGKGAPKKADAATWKGWLDGAQRRGEFRQGERDWLGVDAWLNRQPRSVTREDLAAFVRANAVQVEDVVLGDIDRSLPYGWHTEQVDPDDPFSGWVLLDDEREVRGEGDTEAEAIASAQDDDNVEDSREGARFEQYTLPGGTNYRELLLTLPSGAPTNPVAFQFPTAEAAEDYLGDVSAAGFEELDYHVDPADRRVVRWAANPPFRALQLVTEHRGRTIEGETVNHNAFHTNHFTQPNIIAHVRFNERTDADGKRVLFLEEIQSDWHQAGRKRGYSNPANHGVAFVEETEFGPSYRVRYPDGMVRTGFASLEAAQRAATSDEDLGIVPDAPFKGTDEWAMLAFKRMVRWAAEHGFDRIAWTTGEQQAARYDLSKQVSYISAARLADGDYAIRAGDRRGDPVPGLRNKRVPESELEGLLGKELAEKIIKGEGGSFDERTKERTYRGLDLKVGGDGMRAFYDKILPSAVNKWAKRFGAKVGKTKIGRVVNELSVREAGEAPQVGGSTEQHSLDLTDTMREAALAGQPLFNAERPATLASTEDPRFSIRTPTNPTAEDIRIPGEIKLGRGAFASVKDWMSAIGKGKLTDWRPAMLASIPLNHMTDFAKKGMHAVGHYVDLQYQMQAYRNALYRDYDAIAQEWLAFGTKGEGVGGLLGRKVNQQGRELADLMHDSTVAGVDPSRAAEDYAKDPEKARIYRELRARFDSLPEQGRKLYGQVRDAYAKQTSMVEKVLEENLGRAMEINAARADRDLGRELERINEKDIPEAEKDAERAIAHARHQKARKAANQGTTAKIIGLRQKFEAMRVEAPYFPLKRFGQYWAVVRDSNGTMRGFSKFETAAEQTAFAEQMRKQGFHVGVGLDAERDALRDSIDPRFVADIEAILAEAEAPEFLKDEVWQAYLERLPDLSLRKSFIHRKKVPGYNPDALRSFSSSLFHGSYQLARLKYAMEMGEALDVAEEQAKANAPVQGMQVVNELRKRHEFILNPKGGAAAQIATTAAFVYHLGANPAHLFLNATQTAMIGVPVLGSRYGFGHTVSALQRAVRDFAQGKGHIEKAKLTPEERAAMEAFMDAGLIDKTQAHDLAGVGETGVEYSAVRQKVMNKLGWFFHQSERFNREVTALAAYRLARAGGSSHAQAVSRAMKDTYTIHFDYSAAARPRWMQSDTAKVLLVFRNYNVNMLYRLFRDIHQSLRGESPQVRREARRQLGAMMGMYGLMAGTMGVPFYGLTMALAGMFEDDDEPLTAEQQFIAGTVELLGPDVARVLLRGVPGAVFNVDLSERIGMPNLWFRSPDRELEGRDAYYYWMEQLLGATPALAKNVFDGLNLIHQGHIERGVERMLPAAVRSPVRATRFVAEGGATTIEGQPIADLGPGAILAQALGYTPLDLVEQYDTNSMLKGGDSKLERRRRRLIDRYFMAAQNGDNEGMQDAGADIAAFNARNPAYAITRRTMQRSEKLRERNRLMNRSGIVMTRRMQALANEIEGGE